MTLTFLQCRSEGFGATLAVMYVKTGVLLALLMFFSLHFLAIPFPKFLPIYVHNSLLYFIDSAGARCACWYAARYRTVCSSVPLGNSSLLLHCIYAEGFAL